MEKALNRARKSNPHTVATTTAPTTTNSLTTTSQPVVPKVNIVESGPIALVHQATPQQIIVEPLEDEHSDNTSDAIPILPSTSESKKEKKHRHHPGKHRSKKDKVVEGTQVSTEAQTLSQPLSPPPVIRTEVIQPPPPTTTVVEDKMEIVQEEGSEEVNGVEDVRDEEPSVQGSNSTARTNPVSSFNKKLFLLGDDVRLKQNEDPRTIENTQLLWSKDRKCPIFYCVKAEPSSRSKDPESRPKPFIQKVYETVDDNLKNLELVQVVEEYIAMLESHDDVTEFEQKALEQLKTIRREGQQAYDTILKVYVKPKVAKKPSDGPTTNDEDEPTQVKSSKKRKEIAPTTNSSSNEGTVAQETQDKKKKKLSKKKKSVQDDGDDEDELAKALLSYEESKLEQAKKLSLLRIVQQERKIKELKTLSKDEMKKRAKQVIKRDDSSE